MRSSVDDYIGGGCGLLTAVHIVERAEMRLGDSVVVQGTGAVGLSAIALARLAGASRIIAIGAPAIAARARPAHGRRPWCSISGRRPRPNGSSRCARATHGEGADVVVEAAGSAAAIEEGLNLARDRRPLRDRRALHRRRHQHDQRAPADQPQAPRDSGLLGQRGAALPSGALDPRAPCGIDSVARDRRAAVRPAAARTRRSPMPRRCASPRRSSIHGHETSHATESSPRSGRPARTRRCSSELVAAGVDVFRLNFSHGTHDSHATVFDQPFAPPPPAPAATSPSCRISAVPKIRTGRLQADRRCRFVTGDELSASARGDQEGSPAASSHRMPRSSRPRPGDRLLLDDGRIELRVDGYGTAVS